MTLFVQIFVQFSEGKLLYVSVFSALPRTNYFSYSVEDTIAFMEGIGDTELYWFEEPFRECEENNCRLREYLNIHRPRTLIADGESMTNIPLLRSLAEKNFWMFGSQMSAGMASQHGVT